jgi:hypothetical protein
VPFLLTKAHWRTGGTAPPDLPCAHVVPTRGPCTVPRACWVAPETRGGTARVVIVCGVAPPCSNILRAWPGDIHHPKPLGAWQHGGLQGENQHDQPVLRQPLHPNPQVGGEDRHFKWVHGVWGCVVGRGLFLVVDRRFAWKQGAGSVDEAGHWAVHPTHATCGACLCAHACVCVWVRAIGVAWSSGVWLAVGEGLSSLGLPIWLKLLSSHAARSPPPHFTWPSQATLTACSYSRGVLGSE